LAGSGKKKLAMSRRQRKSIIFGCVFLVAVIVWLDRQAGKHIREKLVPPPVCDIDKFNGKSFKVINVVDGDTVDIDIADGKYKHTRIRLLGIDTPETKSPEYPEMYYGTQASQFVKKLVLGRKVMVVIDTIAEKRDKYGRLLAYIKLDDNRCVNEDIVQLGFGYADLRFTHSYFDKYEQLQNKAIKARVGLWKEVKKEQLPKWLQRKRPGIVGF
jgi:micrococcal nuclease